MEAIERAPQLRHPKALQEYFGWSNTYMVICYLSTLQQEDALRINQEVKFDSQVLVKKVPPFTQAVIFLLE